MKQFYVHAEYVGRYGDMLARAKDDAAAAKSYADANGEIGTAEQGWLAWFGDQNAAIMAALLAELDGLIEACGGGASALHRAAAYYGQADQATAAGLDGTLESYSDRDAYRQMYYPDGQWKPV